MPEFNWDVQHRHRVAVGRQIQNRERQRPDATVNFFLEHLFSVESGIRSLPLPVLYFVVHRRCAIADRSYRMLRSTPDGTELVNWLRRYLSFIQE